MEDGENLFTPFATSRKGYCYIQRGLTIRGLYARLSAMLEEKIDGVHQCTVTCFVEGRHTAIIGSVHIRAVIEEELPDMNIFIVLPG